MEGYIWSWGQITADPRFPINHGELLLRNGNIEIHSQHYVGTIVSGEAFFEGRDPHTNVVAHGLSYAPQKAMFFLIYSTHLRKPLNYGIAGVLLRDTTEDVSDGTLEALRHWLDMKMGNADVQFVEWFNHLDGTIDELVEPEGDDG